MTLTEYRMLFALLTKHMEGQAIASSAYEYFSEVRRRIAVQICLLEGKNG